MNIKKQIIRFTLLLTMATMLFSCSEEDKKEVERLDSIWATVNTNPDYTILAAALKKTGLDITLTNAGSFTVFAPNNAAFAASSLPEKTIATINALVIGVPTDNIKIADLRVRLLNHVIGAGTRSTDLLAARYSRTLGFYRGNAPVPNPTPGQGGIMTGNNANQFSLFVNLEAGSVLLNGGATNGGAKVTKADIEVSNGIIHMVDAVLELPTMINHLIANKDLSTLVSVVTSTGGAFGNQSAVLGVFASATNLTPRTLMAPTNLAFTTATTAPNGFLVGKSAADITKTLQYHYLSGIGMRLRTFFTPPAPPATPVDFFIANTAAATAQTFRVSTVAPLGNRIEDNSVAPRSNVARFVTIDIVCVNGMIHIIDKVLEPILP